MQGPSDEVLLGMSVDIGDVLFLIFFLLNAERTIERVRRQLLGSDWNDDIEGQLNEPHVFCEEKILMYSFSVRPF